MKMVHRTAVFFAVLALCASPLGAQSFAERLTWSFRGSVLVFFEDNGNDGDPAPVLPSPGAALACHIWGPLSIELSEDLYATTYGYSFKLDRAVPAAWENRSASVFGFLTGIQVQAIFPINDLLSVRVFGGPAMDLRIVTLAPDLHPDDLKGGENDAQVQTDAVAEYLWGNGRWFLPVVGGGLDFTVNPKFLVGLDLRVWIPLYKMGEDLPPAEGWRFSAGIRITMR